jgi:hypothetical protein
MNDPEHKRFLVSGRDDVGDKHSFETDDTELAEAVAAMMREDSDHVTITENV